MLLMPRANTVNSPPDVADTCTDKSPSVICSTALTKRRIGRVMPRLSRSASSPVSNTLPNAIMAPLSRISC